jgi:glycosyltransferase involved in cell wall biosynthesis
MRDVLFVARDVDAGLLRGIERLASRLAGHGFAARVLCTSGAGDHEAVVEAPALASRWWRPWVARRLADAGRFALPHLLHGLGTETADIVLDLAEAWRRPYLVSIDEFLEPGTRLRFSRKWCKGIAVPCRDLAHELVGQLLIPREWVEVVPPAVEPPEGDADPDASGHVPVVGTASTSLQVGGLATFFDAARRVIAGGLDAEFVVAGPSRVEAGLRRLAPHYGMNEHVTFAGDLEDTRAFWRVLDLYCQPAIRASTGPALRTAMAWSIPSIASDVAGLRGLIEHERSGLLVPPGDPEALADAIRDLLGSPERGASLGLQGRRSIERSCDLGARAGCLARLYQRALDRLATPPSSSTASG